KIAGLYPGSYVASVTVIGYEPQSRMVSIAAGETEEEDFELSPLDENVVTTGIIEGRVFSANDGNAQIVGATVTLTQNDETIATATTDADGFYKIAGLYPGSYVVSVTSTGYEPQSRAVSIAANETTEENFELSPLEENVVTTGIIEGRVISAGIGNVPITGATVTLTQNDETIATATTDEEGFYKIAGLYPGSYVASVTATGYEPQSRTVSIAANETTEEDFELSPLDENVVTTGIVVGRVLSASGGNAPIVGATVTLTQNDETIATATTDADGFYKIAGLYPGSYVASVTVIGYEPQSRMVSIAANETTEENFELSPLDENVVTTGIVEGRVLSAGIGNVSIVGATVTLTQNDETIATATTDGTGFYMFDGLIPGEFTVFASAEGFVTNLSETNPAVVTAGGIVTANVYLSEVTDDDDIYIIIVTVVNGMADEVVFDTADGVRKDLEWSGTHWILKLNAPEVGQITASASGRLPGTAQVSLTSYNNEGVAFVTITLEPITTEATEVTVTFNANGGQPTIQATTVTPGETYATAINSVVEPTRGNDIFLGWFTQSVGGEQVLPSTVVTRAYDHTLFARWQIEEQEVPQEPETQQPIRQQPSRDTGTPYRPTTPQVQQQAYEAAEQLHYVLGYIEHFNERFVAGYEDGTFRPMGSVTRAEAAAFLVRTILDGFSYDVSIPNIDGVFSDVEQGDWFYRYIAWAYAGDLVRGYPDGTFKPNNLITREEFVSIIARNSAIIAENAQFADVDKVSYWARNSVNVAFRTGRMVGDEYGRFNPTDNITRAEAIATISRIIGRNATTTASVANVPGGIHTFSDVTDRSAWFYYYIVDAGNSYWFTDIDNIKVWTRVED
ncbi:MAG: carboxypeptidase regulatory-like domain-containing protein, partial [Defluviitaleaceae bacterium]|nr:carboxypeptidase regulatory-like domain-containing protein [Defluviitaleaceae bacterium]